MQRTSAPPIQVTGLQKRYGDFAALGGVDLEIEQGEVFALLGPNGAGKTTMVEILEGFRKRTGGDVRVLGADPAAAGPDWKARVGVVLQSSGQFDQLSVEEVVGHFAGFYPDALPVGDVIGLVGLEGKRKARCESLSGGQKRRVDLALGLIGNPELIFLDEPTTGFDPAARRQAWDVVRELTSLGKTVVLTTHYLDEAEALADRVGVLIAGQLAAVATPRELGGRSGAEAHVTFSVTEQLAGASLPAIAGEISRRDGFYTIATETPTAVVTALASWARSYGLDEVPGLAVTRPSLEDTYLAMIAERGATLESDGGRL